MQPEVLSSARSDQSILAESTHESRGSIARIERPLTKARRDFAEAFARLVNEHWIRNETAYSNTAIARACGVDEKTVRQWKDDGSPEPGVIGKPMPAGALRLLPAQLYVELVDATTVARGRTPKRALLRLREALADLEGEMAREDGAEVVRALVGAQGQIAGLMKKAVGEQ